MVLSNWFPVVVQQAMERTSDHRVRHAMSVIVKTTVCRHFQRCVFALAERCGAMGTFEQNYMARIEAEAKGVIITEGDVLTLCIRLFSELLLKRYEVPLPDANESLLARHAWSILEENAQLLSQINDGHRSMQFNSLILPQSENVIEAMGHALAYSTAMKAQLPRDVLDIYECAAIRQDPAWYSDKGGISRIGQRIQEDRAVTSMLPRLSDYLAGLHIEN